MRLSRTAGREPPRPEERSTSPPERRAGVLSDIAVLLEGAGGSAPAGADHGSAVGGDRLPPQTRGRRHLEIHRRDGEATLRPARRPGRPVTRTDGGQDLRL